MSKTVLGFHIFSIILLALTLLFCSAANAASVEKGTVIGAYAFCADESSMITLIEEVIIPNNKDRYVEIVFLDKNVKCYDGRATGLPPLTLEILYLWTVVKTGYGDFEIYKAKTVDTKEEVFTWTVVNAGDPS